MTDSDLDSDLLAALKRIEDFGPLTVADEGGQLHVRSDHADELVRLEYARRIAGLGTVTITARGRHTLAAIDGRRAITLDHPDSPAGRGHDRAGWQGGHRR